MIYPESIHAFFDRLQECLPNYVSAMPSIRFGLYVTCIILCAGTFIAYLDRTRTHDHKDVLMQYRFVLIFIIALVIALHVGELMRDKHYTFACITQNKNHFAAVHWLKLYANSLKALRPVVHAS